MRFKVTPKDFMLFLLYCGILLYFCAIAVLNLFSFANDGTFYGLLPFKAFTSEYIIYTFGLFIAILIIIFTSVSSWIFDKEKGSGFGLHLSEKSSDGYSKWASEKDIKTDKGIEKVNPTDNDIKAAGIPLINNGKEMWVDNGEFHNLVIGATGSGKTECIVKPLVNILSKKGESMVITDPKGEIYEYCGEYLKSQGYNIVILNFRDPEHGNAWNPLSLPYQYYKSGNKDKAIELLEDVSSNIIKEKNANADPFWEDSAADYFSALALSLFKDAKEDEINFNSINVMSTVGEERRGTSTYIKDYFSMKGEESQEYMFASNTITAPQDTKGSILSSFRQRVRIFSTRESLSEMLSHSDFDMQKIGDEKTAVFMIIHDEKKTYHTLMTIFIKQCYETLIDCAQRNGGKLKYRTNFILDEFANMPELKDVDAMVTAARSRDIRFTFIIQNFAQLNDVYGENIAQVIRGNCGNLIYLISTELKALEEISKMCGEVKSKEKDKTASTPLVTVTDLQKMKLFEAIIIRWRKSPFRTKLTPDFKLDWGINRDKATLPTRNTSEPAIFDIKGYVTAKKKDEMMNNPGLKNVSGNPFLGGSSVNPFLGNMPKTSPTPSGMFGSPFGPSSSEIDDMINEIEKKLAKMDEEEKAQKAKVEKAAVKAPKMLELPEDEVLVKPIKKVSHDDELEKIQKTIKEIEEEEKRIDNLGDDLDLTQEIKITPDEKPVINVDKDSVVVNENVVTDDEYYDDFFDE